MIRNKFLSKYSVQDEVNEIFVTAPEEHVPHNSH